MIETACQKLHRVFLSGNRKPPPQRGSKLVIAILFRHVPEHSSPASLQYAPGLGYYGATFSCSP